MGGTWQNHQHLGRFAINVFGLERHGIIFLILRAMSKSQPSIFQQISGVKRHALVTSDMAAPTCINPDRSTPIYIDPRHLYCSKKAVHLYFISIYIRIYITRCSPRATNDLAKPLFSKKTFSRKSHQVKSYKMGPPVERWRSVG